LRAIGATGYLDTDYEGKADRAIEALEIRDFVYIHVEAPDEAGHEGDVNKKIKAIEDLDKRLIGKILNSLRGREFTIGILPDHATPIEVRTHTTDPVPFAIYSTERKGDSVESYSERSAELGSYGIKEGTEFMRILGKVREIQEEKREGRRRGPRETGTARRSGRNCPREARTAGRNRKTETVGGDGETGTAGRNRKTETVGGDGETGTAERGGET